MQKHLGFSLVELLIVVAIILIIAAIAIPGLIRARIVANETSAVSTLRTIVTTNNQFSTTYGRGYAPALANLGGGPGCVAAYANACLIDPQLTGGSKTGFSFTVTPNTGAGTVASPYQGFEADATPLGVGVSGNRSFCSDATGVIHFDPTGAAIGNGAGTCAGMPSAQIVQ